jgi:hypothetical protein
VSGLRRFFGPDSLAEGGDFSQARMIEVTEAGKVIYKRIEPPVRPSMRFADAQHQLPGASPDRGDREASPALRAVGRESGAGAPGGAADGGLKSRPRRKRGLRQALWHGPLNAPVCPRRFQATAFPHRFEPSPSLLEPDGAFGFRPAGSRRRQQTFLGTIPAGVTFGQPPRFGHARTTRKSKYL